MTRAEFEAALAALRRETEVPGGGYGNTGCHDVRSSTFCVDCKDCFRCTHCSGCEGCSLATHCHDCRAVHASSHCVASTRCTESHQLVACEDCVRCVYCFGCVGLVGAEFHILNEPFPRKAYFERVAALKQALGLS